MPRKSASQLAVKIEQAEGTAEALTLTEAILVSNLDYKPILEVYKSDVSRGSFSRTPSISGSFAGKFTFDVELKGSGDKDEAPDFGPLLEACGLDVTENASTSVTAEPITTGIPSLTMGAYLDGVLVTMVGCRGNVKFAIAVGKPCIMSFEFTGCGITPTDVGLLVPTYTVINPPAFIDSSFLIDSYGAIISKIEWDMGNEVQLRQSINSPSGFLSAWITGRNPKGSLDPELPLIATYDFFAKWKSSAVGAISLGAGSVEGNIIAISIPYAKYANINPGDRNGIRILGMDFELCSGAEGDDELLITLT